MKTINVQIQEAKSTLRKKKVKKSTWYLIIKLLKMSDKEKILKVTRGTKYITIWRIKMTAYVLSKTMKARD